jgi:hypothetical protein
VALNICGSSVRTCFSTPLWRLEILSGSDILENFWTPVEEQALQSLKTEIFDKNKVLIFLIQNDFKFTIKFFIYMCTKQGKINM